MCQEAFFSSLLVHALANELFEGTAPESVVAFTFTNKAAEELQARVHGIVLKQQGTIDITGLSVSTIHSWCLEFLRQEAQFYNFDSVDELHLDSLVGRCYERLGLEAIYGKRFPFGIKPFLKDLEVFYNESVPLSEVPSPIRPAVAGLLQTLRENRLLSYGDMIHHAKHVLQERYPQGLPYLECLFVDEYQDVNPAQVELIRAMCQPNTRLAVVGDELQCIYQWRGSDVKRIVEFMWDFPDSGHFPLVKNRRARPGLVRFANRIAENIELRVPKTMEAHRPEARGETVYHLHADGETEQACYVARVATRLRENGVHYSEMAVLLRSVRSSGPAIAEAFGREGVPYECALLGRSDEFIEHCLEPLFDWLRNRNAEPKNEQEAHDIQETRERLWSGFQSFLPEDSPEEVFWYALADWRQLIMRSDGHAYDVRGCLYTFLDQIGLHIAPGDRDLMMALGIATQIIRSVEEVQRRRIRGLTRKNPASIAADIYFALRRWKDEFGETRPIDTSADAVTISTVHKAKGLEWPVVIIPTLNRGRFPVNSSEHGTSFPDEVAGRYGTTAEDEWRLFYVAATRARERLFLMSYGDSRSRSTFIECLGPHCAALDPGALEDSSNGAWQIDAARDDTEGPIVRAALSDLLLYMECPYQYALRRVCEVQPSVSDELGYGRSLHELVQRRLENGAPWTTRELESQVDQYVHMPYTSEKQEAQSKVAIKERVEDLEELAALDQATASEVRMELLFEGGSVHGIADGVLLSGEDASIRDWKSNVHDLFLPRYGRQVSFYALCLSERGIRVGSAEIVDIGASHRQGKLVLFLVDCGSAKLRRSRSEFGSAVAGLAARQFAPTPSKSSCSCCDMFRLCAVREVTAQTVCEAECPGGKHRS